MSAALVGSPSSFLRMSLARQLRQRWQNLLTMEAASAAEAMRIVAESTIDFAIVDEALLTERTGANLAAALSFIAKRTILIATGGAPRLAPTLRQSFLVIDGEIEGVLNMGAISSALPHALDHLVTASNRRYTPSATATIVAQPRLDEGCRGRSHSRIDRWPDRPGNASQADWKVAAPHHHCPTHAGGPDGWLCALSG